MGSGIKGAHTKKKRILVVDDDSAVRFAIQAALEVAGHTVRVATGGKPAQDLLALESFDAVISDIRMPEGNGIELTQFLKGHKPEIPIILMTGFADFGEAGDAYAIGADEFIPKPFHNEELLEALQACLGQPGKQDFADEYCKVSIDDFISSRLTQFNLYIRLGESKYIKIAHKGDPVPIDQIAAYRQRNVKHLYMRKDDLRAYIGLSVSIAKILNKEGQIAKAKKLNFLKHTTEVLLEHVFAEGIDKEMFDSSRTVVETTVTLLADDKDALSLLNMLNSHSDHLYAHSLGVSLYGVMIARHLKWTSTSTIFKVSMGGLFHDVGLKELDRAIIDKKRKDMTAEEIKLYESHPLRGLEILSEVHSVPSDILQVVQQHHENCLGQGFPSGLQRQHIHPLARLTAVADEFCELTLKTSKNPGLPPREAAQRMVTLGAQTLDPEFLRAILEMLKLPVPSFLIG